MEFLIIEEFTRQPHIESLFLSGNQTHFSFTIDCCLLFQEEIE